MTISPLSASLEIPDTFLVPGDSCFWTIMPSDALHSSTNALRYRFENDLPFSCERLHCAFIRLPDGRVLGVGVATEELEQALAGLAAQAWHLRPDRIPDELGLDNSTDITKLELLYGRFEPRPVRRLRRLCLIIGFVAFGGTAGAFAGMGTWQAHQLHDEATILQAEQNRIAATAVAGLGIQPGQERLPMGIRLLMAYRERQPFNSGDGLRRDLLPVVERCLAGMPNMPIAIEEVTANQDRIIVRGQVAGTTDPGLLQADPQAPSLAGLGWKPDAVDLRRSVTGELLVTMTWRPQAEGVP